MRLKELRGLPVIDPTAARKVGKVVDFQVDPASGRLAALDIDASGAATNARSDPERIVAQRIRRVGRSAVILTGRGGAVPGTVPEVNERWLDTSTLVGLEIMGDDGNLIGRLVDANFDQDTLEVDTYLLGASFWERLLGRRGRIQPSKVHSCSRELMIVTTGHLQETLASAAEDMPTVGLHVPLNAEDRNGAPVFDNIQEREPVSTNGH
jgi:sporulation protein YlmC with PRC-barrel domain